MTNTIPDATAAEPTTEKLALAWTHTARFLTTASQLVHLPATELPEIAFVGRSNAGKSTAINTLAQQKRLAFASKTPGRTQHINLFEVGPKGAPDVLFADLVKPVRRDFKLQLVYFEGRLKISGNVMRRKVAQGGSPRSRAASKMLSSMPARRARTITATKPIEKVTWAIRIDRKPSRTTSAWPCLPRWSYSETFTRPGSSSTVSTASMKLMASAANACARSRPSPARAGSSTATSSPPT